MPPAPAAGETILLAEDEPAVRTLVGAILRRQGYRVLDAQGGADALALAAAHEGRIDLLLTDVVMPDTNGVQLAKRLVRDRPDLKVVYMSGYAEHALADGVDRDAIVHFISKPFTSNVLCARVREVLDQG
jgi:CheY-like chemotaxis protein